jgi:hypothetical protein
MDSLGPQIQGLRDQMRHLQEQVHETTRKSTFSECTLSIHSPLNTSPASSDLLRNSDRNLPRPESLTQFPGASGLDFASLVLSWQEINQNLSFTRQGLKVRLALLTSLLTSRHWSLLFV